MAIRTWEVKLLAGNNGVIQTNVQADAFEISQDGVEFTKNVEPDRVQVAFFPMAPLLSVKDVTP